jgi:phosphoenolpyruvate synthase/pyruvate phosphate dikinase
MAEGPTIIGIPASPGRRRGRARVLSRIADISDVRSGEILVTRAMVPDLVLAFDRIAAVVTDHGGRLAHASVVARELGVPAVVGTQVATAQIPDGSLVVIDGSAGSVVVEGPPTDS